MDTTLTRAAISAAVIIGLTMTVAPNAVAAPRATVTTGGNTYLVLTPDDADTAATKLRTRVKDEPTYYQRMENTLDGVWVLGGDAQTSCTDSNVDWSDIVLRSVRAAEEKVTIHLEYAEAQRDLRAARLSLPCLSQPAERETLWKMYFLEGVANFFEGNEGAATIAFSRALAIKPNEAYPIAYPPQANTAYVHAQETVLDKDRAIVAAGIHDANAAGAVFVDGVLVENGFTGVFPGEHLVQVRDVAGKYAGATFKLNSKEVIALVSPRDAFAILPMLAQEHELQLQTWIIKKTQVAAKHVAVHDGGSGFTVLGLPSGGTARFQLESSRFVLAFNGGYHYTTANYGGGEVDMAGRIVAPLYLTGFARVVVSEPIIDPATGESIGRQLLPVFGLGARVRWDWPIGQTVGLVAQVAPNPDGSDGTRVLVGGALDGGIDIPLGRDAPVFIRMRGQVGFLGRNLTVGGFAGFGFRVR